MLPQIQIFIAALVMALMAATGGLGAAHWLDRADEGALALAWVFLCLAAVAVGNLGLRVLISLPGRAR